MRSSEVARRAEQDSDEDERNAQKTERQLCFGDAADEFARQTLQLGFRRCMSRPGATDDDPETEALDDPRAEALRQTYVRERERSEEMEFEQYEDSL